MDPQKQQVIDRLNAANNILVTVSRNPSVDQLSAAIGITLLLNKLGKHATAVYSGKTPSTIEFLQPEKTIEKNTDSLRDFIIALDKSKADKLRYKVEDQMVKIFITPYRTSISDKDLEFSQGDFNVEVVLALGVFKQQDLDQAITAHGRILHDATVIGITAQAGEEALGSINWVEPAASSLSEMMAHMGFALEGTVLDEQISTALLTGIVAETERFSNQKTTAETMQASAKLMEAGANQQLVATELATPALLGKKVSDDDQADTDTEASPEAAQVSADGALVIEHEPGEMPPEKNDSENLELPEPKEEPPVEHIDIDYDGQIKTEPSASADVVEDENDTTLQGSSRLVLQPPTLGGKLTANSEPEGLDPSVDPLSSATPTPLLRRDSSPVTDPQVKEPEAPSTSELPSSNTETEQRTVNPPNSVSSSDEPTLVVNEEKKDTLSDLEKFVSSPHLAKPTEPAPVTEADRNNVPTGATPAPETPSSQPAPEASPESPVTDIGSARDAVDQAVNSVPPAAFDPVQSLNAVPVDLDLGDIPAVNTSPASAFADQSTNIPTEQPQPPDMVSPSLVSEPIDTHVASDPGLPEGLITNEPTDITASPHASATSSPAVPSQGPAPAVPPPMMPPNLTPPAGAGNSQPTPPNP